MKLLIRQTSLSRNQNIFITTSAYQFCDLFPTRHTAKDYYQELMYRPMKHIADTMKVLNMSIDRSGFCKRKIYDILLC